MIETDCSSENRMVL